MFEQQSPSRGIQPLQCDPDVESNMRFTSRLPLRRVDVFPLRDAWEHHLVPTIVYFSTIGRSIFVQSYSQESEPLLVATAYAEMFGPVMRQELFDYANAAEAQKEFVNSVKGLLASDVMRSLTRAKREDYLRACSAFHGNSVVHLSLNLGRMQVEDWPEHVDDSLPLSPESAMRVLCFLAKNARDRHKMPPIAIAAHVLVAMLRQGMVDNAMILSLQRDIRASFSMPVELCAKTIRILFGFMDYKVDASKANIMRLILQDFLPEQGDRLLHVLLQITNPCLSEYFCIRNATERHPAFGWWRVHALFSNDSLNFNATYRAVGTNMWNALVTDLAPSRAMMYPNLVHVAIQLFKLFNECGDRTWNITSTGTNAHKDVIEEIFQEYKDYRDQLQEAENQATTSS